MTKICFVIPFFMQKRLFSLSESKFPKYFEYFIETFSKNEGVSLTIFTNIPHEKYKRKNSSIKFVSMSFRDVANLFRARLGLKLKNFHPYKLCDFKPTFGHIFADYLRDYDFWGYCDIDMIIGNLGKFFNEENLEGYELITASTGNPGYMTVYRNCERMNLLFQKSSDHVKVFEEMSNFRFDEGGKHGVIALRQLVQQERIKVNNIRHLVHNDSGSMNQTRNWQYEWNDGILIDCLTQQEIGSLHLVKSKKSKAFIMEPLRRDSAIRVDVSGVYMLDKAVAYPGYQTCFQHS